MDVLVRRYQEVAFRTAWVITRNTEDARDATQTGLFKAVEALSRFEEGRPFRPWLIRIVVNEAKDIRSSTHHRYTAPLDEAAFELRPSPEPSPETTALIHEEQSALLDAVNTLAVDDRLVIAYRYFFGLSETEMAVALDCPRGTVKSRLSRAMARLRDVMLTGDDPIAGGQLHG
ncbi:MAG: sigma-70 family RNA polymerase sigma factor [Thermomicrobiales bacterium]|nr:sigma-70 family RNA polymerase sigma factor [Thermomicrobiales bacterium]